MSNLDINNEMASIMLQGHYNDPDMLEVLYSPGCLDELLT
jgi:hypothetical protein